MPTAQEAWSEFVFQARLKYLALKQATWLLEMLFFIVAFVVAHQVPYPAFWTYAVVLITFLRAVTAAINHAHLAHLFNANDRWAIIFPFI